MGSSGRTTLPVASRLLTRLVPDDLREEVIGDLVEVHTARKRRSPGLAALTTTLDAARVVVTLNADALRRGSTFSASELRLALRLGARQPFLSLTAVLALSVGIGLSASAFTLLHSVVFASLPFPAGSDWVDLDVRSVEERFPVPASAEDVAAVAEGVPLLRGSGAFRTSQVFITAGADVMPLRAAHVTPRTFDHMAIVPVLGRPLVPADAAPGAEPVMVMDARVWRSAWGADPGIVGRTLQVGDEARTVVGIAPEGLGFPDRADLWVPLDETAHASTRMYGILAEGASETAAAAQLSATLSGGRAEPVAVSLRPFTRRGVGGIPEISAVVVALVMVLLLAAANVANLIQARTMARADELAVRTALGAARARLVGQIFLEVLVLGSVAGAVGLAASRGVITWLAATIGELPFWVDLSLSPGVVLFVVLLTLAASTVAGVLPALRVTRGTGAGLAGQGRGVAGAGLGGTARVMIPVQVALSVALLAGSVSLARALSGYAERLDLLPSGEMMTARVYIPPPLSEGQSLQISEAWQTDSIQAIRARVVEALETMTEPRAMAYTTRLPRDEAPLRTVEVEGVASGPTSVAAPVTAVSAGFFEALSVPPTVGREFLPVAPGAALPEAGEVVVNESFVARHMGGRNALGRRVRLVEEVGPDGEAEWLTVVGVVPDLGMSPGDPVHAGGIYVRMGRSNYFHVVMRGAPGAADALVPPLQRVASRLEDVRVDEIMPLEQAGWESRALLGGLSASLGGLGLGALVLSLMGLYAIMAFSVSRRTREIGVRVALGSSRSRVLGSILGRAALQLVGGAVAGWALAVAVLGGTGMLPIRVEPGEPWLAPAVAMLMVAAGLAAAWVPARRALGVEPSEALRAE